MLFILCLGSLTTRCELFYPNGSLIVVFGVPCLVLWSYRFGSGSPVWHCDHLDVETGALSGIVVISMWKREPCLVLWSSRCGSGPCLALWSSRCVEAGPVWYCDHLDVEAGALSGIVIISMWKREPCLALWSSRCRSGSPIWHCDHLDVEAGTLSGIVVISMWKLGPCLALWSSRCGNRSRLLCFPLVYNVCCPS